MTVKRLLTIVVSIAVAACALGILSISAEIQAASAAAQRVARAEPGEQQSLNDPAFLVAELVRDGDRVFLFPQTGEVIRCEGSAILTSDVPYLFEDGKLYTWVNGHRSRIWLFGVIADKKPRIRVDG